MAYRFQTTAYDTEKLLPEVASALNLRMERESRRRLPGIWKVMDKLPGGKTPYEMTRGRRIYRRVTATLLILVGLFLAIPGFVAPDRLLGPAVVGSVVTVHGVYYLWSTRKNRRSTFEKQAKKLLEEVAKAPSALVAFSDTGMTLEGQREIAYSEMAFWTETDSGFFLNWAEQATFLQKKDLIQGEPDAFSAFLREKLA